MKFIPFFDKIYVRPIKSDSMLQVETGQFEETGIVVSVGRDVKFCKPGDTIFFASWLVSKPPEINGDQCYVIPENSGAILGKMGDEAKPTKNVRKK